MSKISKQELLSAVVALEKHSGNKTDAGNSIGLARTTFRERLVAAGMSSKKLADRIELAVSLTNIKAAPEEDVDIDTGKRHAALKALKNKKVNRYVITGAQTSSGQMMNGAQAVNGGILK